MINTCLRADCHVRPSVSFCASRCPDGSADSPPYAATHGPTDKSAQPAAKPGKRGRPFPSGNTFFSRAMLVSGAGGFHGQPLAHRPRSFIHARDILGRALDINLQFYCPAVADQPAERAADDPPQRRAHHGAHSTPEPNPDPIADGLRQ